MNTQEYADLVGLLEACRLLDVRELETQGIKVKFGPGDAVPTVPKASEVAPAPNPKELAETEEIARDTDVAAAADDALAQLAIDDPEAFEDALIQRELETSEQRTDEDDLI